MGELLTAHIDGNENPTHLPTKVLCSAKRKYFVDSILNDIFDGEFKWYTAAE